MLALSQNNISGLKTVTQKELVALAEKHWHHQEQIRRENRKVLEWSGDEDEHMEKEPAKSETHDKILGGLSVDEPWKQQMESLPISPSGTKMHHHQVASSHHQSHNNMNLNLKSDQNSSSNHNQHQHHQGAKPQSTGPRSIHVHSQQNNQD